MKNKIKIITLLIVVCILLCSCDPAVWYFDYDYMMENTVSIEFIIYGNYETKYIRVTEDTKLIFEKEKIKFVEQLPENNIAPFLEGLSKITFFHLNESAIEPIKECLKINLKNDNFYIISSVLREDGASSFVAEFDRDFNFVRHIAAFADRPSYERLIAQYF